MTLNTPKRAVAVAALLALMIASSPNPLPAHGDHQHSPFLELTENPSHLSGKVTIGEQLIRAEAWYNPTPLGKRSAVTFKVFDSNGLNPELLKEVYIRSDDQPTSTPLKVEVDPDLPESYRFVRALPAEAAQEFVLFTTLDAARVTPLVLAGFEKATEEQIEAVKAQANAVAPPPATPAKRALNWWALVLTAAVLFGLFAGVRRWSR